jgi:hypothetical protein
LSAKPIKPILFNNSARTNNHIEGWHGKIKKHLNHAHPNIFVLIELLQKTQANTEANQMQISAGGTQRPRLKKYRNIDNRQSTLKHRFLQAELTVQDYTDQATFLLHMEMRQ